MRGRTGSVLILLLFLAIMVGNIFAQTTVANIRAAWKNQEITDDEYYLYLTYAVHDREALPQSLVGSDHLKSATTVLVEVWNHLEEVTPLTRSIISSYLARPTGLTNSHSTTHFKFHFTLSGTDRVPNEGYVVDMGTHFENAWTFITGTMGYLTPPSDGSAGGDGKYDIYCLELPGGIMGYTQPEWGGSYSWNDATSFIAMDNNYTEFGWPALDCKKITSVHEFFHAVQMSYDVSEEVFWMEISSVWIEDEYYPTIDQELSYLPYFFNSPWVSLTTYDGSHEYGSYHWGKFIDMNFGRNSIRDIWEECRYASVFSATQSVLSDLGSDRNSAFSEFVQWNYFTGSRTTGMHYNDADDFPEVTFHAIHSTYPATGNSGSHSPDALASDYIRFNLPGTAEGPFTITFDGQDGYLWNAQVMKVTSLTSYEVISIPLNSYNYGHLQIEQDDYEELDYVIFIPTVLSTGGEDLTFTYSANFEVVGPELNPPRNLIAESGHDGEIPLRWDPPEGAGGLEELYYDDGTPAGAYECETGDFESVRFTATSSCTIYAVKLWVYDETETYDDIQLHFFEDDGGFPDPLSPLGTPVNISPNPFPESTLVDVSGMGILLDSPRDFHVGMMHLTDNPCLLVDATAPAENRSIFFAAAETTLYYAGGDYLLRCYVKYSGGSTGPTHYRVYRSSFPGASYTFRGSSYGLTYLDDAVVDGTPYYYVVTAYYAAGESPYSNEASATSGHSGGEYDTLLADDGDPETTVWGGYAGTRFATRLSPDSLCQILSLEFLTYNPSDLERDFYFNVYEWTGGRVGNALLPPYWRGTAPPGLAWSHVDIAAFYDLYTSGDFLPSFEMAADTNIYICYDDEDTDRSWDYYGTAWTASDMTYYIRAVVRYVSSDETYSLRGNVDLPGRADKSGSTVKIEGIGLVDTTDELGDYLITGVPVGTYNVIADHFGYEEMEAILSMHGDQTRNFVLVGTPTPINEPQNLIAVSYNSGVVPLFWTPPQGEPGTSEEIYYFTDTVSTYWYPDDAAASAGDIECTRFQVWFPCSLYYIAIMAYDPRGRYRDMELHLWDDDGDGFPNLDSDIMNPDTISPDSFPYWTLIDYRDEGIIFEPGQEFHIGQVKLNQYPSILADDSAVTAEDRSLHYLDDEEAWFPHADYFIAIGVKYFAMEYRMYRRTPDFVYSKPKRNFEYITPSNSISLEGSILPPDFGFYRTAPTVVEDYYIYRGTGPRGPFTPIGFSEEEEYFDSSVTNGTMYYYFVTAMHERGESETSDTVSAMPWGYIDSAEVLLVDDDGSAYTWHNNQSHYYMDALDELGVEYNVFEMIGYDSLSLDDLSPYKAVIWFMGALFSDSLTLTPWDEQLLGNYLDNGGKLFLIGQDYLWDRYPGGSTGRYTFSGSEFPRTHLDLLSVTHDEWTVVDDTALTLTGDSSGFACGMSFTLTNPFENINVFIDDLSYSGEAVFLLSGAGVGPGIPVAQGAENNVVFSSVPLGAMAEGPFPSTHAEFINRILYDYFDIDAPAGIIANYNITAGWHMLSLPLDIPDKSAETVFPGHEGNVWYFNPEVSAYEPADNIEIGRGYFVLYLSDTNYSLVGPPVTGYAFEAVPGWHIVGSVWRESGITIDSVVTDPDGLALDGSWYGFNNEASAYVTADRIMPMLAYWVLITDSCDFMLPAVPAMKRTLGEKIPQFRLELKGEGFTDLSLGFDREASGNFEPEFDRPLPPPPPQGNREIYLTGSDHIRYAQSIVGNGPDIAWGLVVNNYEPVSFSWEKPELPGKTSIRLTGKVTDIDMMEAQSAVLNPGIYKILLSESNTPGNYYLHQNFPNPFNAVTRIEYGLPEQAKVSLEIYNVLGGHVRTLFSGEQEPGRKVVLWDGKDDSGQDCSAGIYFYSIHAGSFK
ncbi:hypothetical protein JW877_04280, partial [bacterium]|nr:hypothetical protein [bacterium]